MKNGIKAACALTSLLLVAGCGKNGGASGCEGLTMDGQLSGIVGRYVSVRVTNASDSPELVTISVVSPQGQTQLTDGPFRVSAKDAVIRQQIAFIPHSHADSFEALKAEGWSFPMKCQ